MSALLLALLAAAEPNLSLAVEGTEEEAQLVTASLDELLQRLRLHRVPPGEEATFRAAVRFSSSEGTQVTLKDAADRLLLLRRLPKAASAALAAEAAAHVLYSAVEELLEPPAPPPAAPAPPPPEPTRFRVTASVFAGGRAFGGGAPIVLTAGLGAAVAWHRIGLWMGAAYAAPFEAGDTFASVRSHSVSLRLLPTFDVLTFERWALEVGAGGGAELFITSARSSMLPPHLLARDRVDVSPLLSARVAARVAVAGRLSAVLGFLLDVDLRPPRFVSESPDGRQPIFTPWRVRPTFTLGLAFDAVREP